MHLNSMGESKCLTAFLHLIIKWNEIWRFPMNREQENKLPKAARPEIGESKLNGQDFQRDCRREGFTGR